MSCLRAETRLASNPSGPGAHLLRVACAVVLALLVRPGVAAQGAGPDHVLTTARSVHELPADRVSGASVHLVGTITYYDSPELILFLQDATGGVFINVDRSYPFHDGQKLEVDGSVKKSFRAEVAPGARLRVLGSGAPIAATPATYDQLASGEMDSKFVSVSGEVKDAVIERHPEAHTQTLHMDLALDHGQVEVYVRDYRAINPISLLGQTIELKAVAGGTFDGKDQMTGIVLYAPDASAFRVISRSAVNLATLPITDVDNIFSSMRHVDASPMVHVRGALVYYADGEGAVLEQDGKSLYVHTRETRDIDLGEIVDAYGFPDNRGYSPSLQETVLIPTGQRHTVTPVRLGYGAALSGLYSDRLVSIEGRLISQVHTQDTQALTIETDGHTVRGLVRAGETLPIFPLNTRIRMTGICRIVDGGPWHQPVLFYVAMRTSNDVLVIAAPSWWTVRHLAPLLAILLIIAMAVATWALVLRMRVARQSQQIERSMRLARARSEILQMITNNVPMPSLLKALTLIIKTLMPGTSSTYTWGTSRDEAPQEADPCMFSMPLFQDETFAGEFAVHGRPSLRQHEEEEVFLMLREVLSVALQHHSLHEGLVLHSTHDSLTMLPNRRLCETRLDEALEAAVDLNTPLAVIYVDVDKFKMVNDRHGHHTGDLYLQAIGKRFSAELRSGDTVARVGGDEFVIVLPNARPDEAQRILTRMQQCFESAFLLGGVLLMGSASFGLACVPQHGATREALERHADAAMYAAKRRAQEDVDASAGQGAR